MRLQKQHWKQEKHNDNLNPSSADRSGSVTNAYPELAGRDLVVMTQANVRTASTAAQGLV
jgi:hypothetical protein